MTLLDEVRAVPTTMTIMTDAARRDRKLTSAGGRYAVRLADLDRLSDETGVELLVGEVEAALGALVRQARHDEVDVDWATLVLTVQLSPLDGVSHGRMVQVAARAEPRVFELRAHP